MEGLGYTCDLFEHPAYNHDVYSKPPTLEFEMHHTLFSSIEVPQFVAYYADVSDRVLKNGCEWQFSNEDFYLYIVCHTYKHFIHAGSGLRSLLDVYVFLRAHPDLDRTYVDAELTKLQISEFEEKIRRLSHQLFTGRCWDEQDQKTIDYLIASGSKGTVDHSEYHQMLNKLGNDDSKAAKRRLLMRRIFLSGEALEKQYPFFARHKALYPVLLLYRPIRGAVTHPKGILTEYKKIKHFKKKEEP
jgi:hypothetical protein